MPLSLISSWKETIKGYFTMPFYICPKGYVDCARPMNSAHGRPLSPACVAEPWSSRRRARAGFRVYHSGFRVSELPCLNPVEFQG